MINININLINIKDNLKIINTKLDNYKDDYLKLNRNLKNIDASWDDINSNIFLKTISHDKKNFLEHINSIRKYLKKTEEFCEDLELELIKILNLKKINKIQINFEFINKTIDNLNNCYNDLIKIIYIMSKSDIVIPSDFKYKCDIETIKSDLENSNESILNLKEKLFKIKKKISFVLEKSKFKVNQVDFKTINNKFLDYHWKTYKIEKNNNLESKIKAIKSKSNKIDININNSINLNDNKINTKQSKININMLNEIENKEKSLNTNIDEVKFNTEKQESVTFQNLYQNDKTINNIKFENKKNENIDSLRANDKK